MASHQASHQKNELVTLTIERWGSSGEGIAHLDGQVVFVPGALPRETCVVQLLKVGKTALWGRVSEVLTPSPSRIASDCPHYPKCGGCQFRHADYAAECEAKAQRIEDALLRLGGCDLKLSAFFAAEDICRYRNKMQLPVSDSADGPHIGFFRARSHDVVDVADCLLQPETARDVCAAVRAWMQTFTVPAYQETPHKGVVRHVFLRFSQTQVLCCIVANAQKLPHEAELIEALRAAAPSLAGIVLSSNTAQTNVVLGKTQRTLWGENFLDDTLCGLTFRISVPSFYQVNRTQAEVLYGQALLCAGLTGTETVLDLYCGIGTISLVMAQRAAHVIGAELIPAAVEDARQNALRNHITNAVFICADAGEAAQALAKQGTLPDVICVDPPRKGLEPQVIAAIISMSPARLVYVSCDSATLARDLKLLSPHYTPQKVIAVDLFPRTAHSECVVLFTKS